MPHRGGRRYPTCYARRVSASSAVRVFDRCTPTTFDPHESRMNPLRYVSQIENAPPTGGRHNSRRVSMQSLIRRICFFMLAGGAVLVQAAPLPEASPEEVGISSERLGRLDA